MPTLDWIGKQAVVNHHQEVPCHLLRGGPELGCGPANSGNLVVEGDNLTRLKALTPCRAGQVKCICIAPPCNTGTECWVYQVNVKSSIIRQWFGKAVGKKGEALDRQRPSWLPTATDRFYPDFVCKLTDRRILVVECKGSDRRSNDGSREKRRLGELRAERSGGKCFFVMPNETDPADMLSVIKAKKS